MTVYHDQLGRAINLPNVPKRIISVVPSQTELLFYLGLDAEVIGITKFCIHPANRFKTITKVGGTKQLDLQGIAELNPDLIIANKEENDQAQIEHLMQHYPVWISDIQDLNGALEMIRSVGELTGRGAESRLLQEMIAVRFEQLMLPSFNLSVAYFIWRKPYMVAGTGTFINNMLRYCGLINVIEQSRYPEISVEEITTARPNVIFLSSEPYPFKQKHIGEFQQMLPSAKIVLVDGEIFSWYGNRLLQAPAYFTELMKGLIKN